MSPELKGDEANARTDIFAFWAILFEVITRRKRSKVSQPVVRQNKTVSFFKTGHTASLGAAAIVLAVLVSACRADASVAADEQAIRDADERYNAAVVQRDLDKIMGFYAPNAVSMSPGDPPEHGVDAIRAAWKPLLATPGFKLRIIPEKIDVARAETWRSNLGTPMSRGRCPIGS